MPKMFLTDREVGEVFGIGRATVWRWLDCGKLPQPVRLSGKCTRWRVSDIENFAATAT
ncbi:helix-turn-helix transcriptional regulator [Phaeobacter gallaeciensis]|uniref:helix-turn-helix transcriptional regulator n=2 Tax=Phaeobacter gallaeciensis TaxID=60890 RepID=UPI00237F1F91|nr:AlpA family phage regulatory protein [Phaeobacter gallaeciensis]MDE4140963.1 AlpA family phage regulatory protein [Phaeobacter gallaeciensis]MDE4149408.1 AlpA family phage regulatory protein [Phaeobacter gallaeciensis]MDE4228788.1 AlpA family phage regulatory protein [Phaeobacter gallaeciensis]MDE4257863.1 AlpA family phage regulatory protein [Phaeobacter gallaeciensis]MDE4266289.1 AlpA family phage regulatory protein [Phaeobacter gallaeciensis]